MKNGFIKILNRQVAIDKVSAVRVAVASLNTPGLNLMEATDISPSRVNALVEEFDQSLRKLLRAQEEALKEEGII